MRDCRGHLDGLEREVALGECGSGEARWWIAHLSDQVAVIDRRLSKERGVIGSMKTDRDRRGEELHVPSHLR